MFEVALLYPDRQQGAAKRYGMPQDMSKDLNLSVILRVMAKEDEEIFTNCQRVLLCLRLGDSLICGIRVCPPLLYSKTIPWKMLSATLLLLNYA